MNQKLAVRIILPSETFLDMQANQVDMPGSEGYFGVLYGHVKMISSLSIGVVILFIEGEMKKYYVHGGVVQITGDEVNIVTEYAASIAESNKTTIKNEIIDLESELSLLESSSIEALIILNKIDKHKSLINFL